MCECCEEERHIVNNRFNILEFVNKTLAECVLGRFRLCYSKCDLLFFLAFLCFFVMYFAVSFKLINLSVSNSTVNRLLLESVSLINFSRTDLFSRDPNTNIY